MDTFYVIRNDRGHYWQTGRGFDSRDRESGEVFAHLVLGQATRYESQDEAEKVIGFCVQAASYVERVRS